MRLFRNALRMTGLVLLLSAVGLPAVNAQPFQPVIVSELPVSWTPHAVDIDGRVEGIAQVGNTIVAGGEFTGVAQVKDGPIIPRSNIFAFNATTGSISMTFAPVLNGRVLSIVPAGDGQSVFVGGAFTNVSGISRKRMVKLNVATGQVDPTFKANVDNWVWDAEVSGGRLYMAGVFTTVNGVARQALASVDPVTGALLPDPDFTFSQVRTGNPRVQKFAITPDGTKMVALGNFTLVSGADRKQIAMFDLTTSPISLSNWQTEVFPQVVPNTTTSWCTATYDQYLRDVDFSPDGTWFVVGTTGAFRANRMCDTVSRWETNASGTNLQPTWVDWSGGDSTTQVAVTGTAVYVGGHQRWWNNPYRGDVAGPGAVSHEGLAAFDPVNGLPYSWDPTRDRGKGVFAFLTTPAGLWIGSDTDRIHTQYHGKIAFLPLAGGKAVAPTVPYSLPNDLYNLEPSGSMVRRPYDGSTFGARVTVPTGVNWSTARGAFALNGVLYTGVNNGTLVSQTFDGTNVGPATPLDLHGLNVQPPSTFLIPGTNTRVPAFSTELTNMTGMFFSNGRIYYTVSGNPRLYYRYFTPESGVVGANLFVASTTVAGGVAWENVRGMTMASGTLYVASTNGNLSRVPFSGAPVGSPTVIGGPGIDGYNWASQGGLFAFTQTTDTLAPTAPGKPAGVSHATDSIEVTWPASHDNLSTSLTYRIYRDGGPTPVGTVISSSTTTVSFTDQGLTAGSSHTYTVDAQDAVPLTSAMSPPSDPITVQVPDTTAPTVPGTPTGAANGKTKIDLTFGASTDDRTTTITYRIYRDGGPTPIGTVTSASTTTVSFTDIGLAPGSSHTYSVDAQDVVPNTSLQSSASDPITTVGELFADSFSGGNFASWTSVTRLTIDPASGATTAPSARGQVSGQSGFAIKDLSSPVSNVCMSEAVNVSSQAAQAVALMRLLSPTGGGIMRVFLSATGVLFVKSDVSGVQKSSVTTPPPGWNRIELCGTVGSTSSWDLYLNGSKIINAWSSDTGNTAVGRVQIGDDSSKTWTINFDDVVVDQIPG